jgi:hypothetical protein
MYSAKEKGEYNKLSNILKMDLSHPTLVAYTFV